MRVVTYQEEVSIIQDAINSLPRPLQILEAGCGRKWALRIHHPYRVTGIDVDETALRARRDKVGDLAEYRVGDLVSATFPRQAFDVIYCSYVLEHVVGVERVLQNFAMWLKPEGLLIIRVPDSRSVYGFFAKHTPFFLHVWYKRWIDGNKNAGKSGYNPYPVRYERAMSRGGIEEFCVENGFALKAVCGNNGYLSKLGPLGALVRLLSMLSVGRLAWRHNNLLFVIGR